MNNDLISREELKGCIEQWFAMVRYYHPYSKSTNIPKEEVFDLINHTPTVTVEPDKVLVANVTFDEDKLKALVQKEVIGKIKSGELVIKDERPQGEWVGDGFVFCNQCGCSHGTHKTNFCPNCGADMRGGAE